MGREIDVMSNGKQELEGVAALIAGLPDAEPRSEWRAGLEARLTSYPVVIPDAEARPEWRAALDARLAQEAVAVPVSGLTDAEPSISWREALTARLEQARAAEVVAALPDDPPSMVWRSGVQEALVKTQPQVKRASWLRVLMPATGFAAAAAIALVAIGPMRRSSAPATTSLTPEEQIVSMHFAQEFAVSEQVGVLGAPTAAARADVPTIEWSDADLGAW